ncbi:ABC transporter substrate-binding protein [Nocardiopsis sp. HUAS JQ3]|uniref:ABC transporter substrate-binding protein n=1 Tax=Nocardiopsis sp. HUAS JQ3 TaxID=3061629 RepID=UPI0023A9C2AD|nr:hypothetical protein [Nocardiopsis sp. HUAS JQ3]WDZ92770.1 hypothetical protein PV789_09680 [Nocardiopsis sp. HUAS JQ3]
MGAHDTLLISPNHPVFDLPEIVAIEHGLFARHGLDVRFAEADPSAYDPSERDPIARRKEALYETEGADVYNLCEWGGIDRLERGRRDGRIDYLRPAVVAQALVSFDPLLNEPHDLGGVPVAVNEFTGSHYTALHLLGNTLARQEVVLRHVGSPHLRLRALRSGRARAAMLMEPFLSTALKEGAHLLGSYFYRGSQVVAPHLGQERRDAYVLAVNEAVDLINGRPWPESAAHIVREVGGALSPDELSRAHVRYTHARAFEPKRFHESYAWMKSWGLTEGRNDYGSLLGAR